MCACVCVCVRVCASQIKRAFHVFARVQQMIQSLRDLRKKIADFDFDFQVRETAIPHFGTFFPENSRKIDPASDHVIETKPT